MAYLKQKLYYLFKTANQKEFQLSTIKFKHLVRQKYRTSELFKKV